MTKDFFGNGFDMLFSELNKIMVNKVAFVGCRGSIAPSPFRSATASIQPETNDFFTKISSKASSTGKNFDEKNAVIVSL